MAAPRNAFKVGVMAVICIATAFGILVWIGKGVGRDTRILKIRFKCDPNLPTLSEGSAVLVGGQKVGRVLKARVERNMEAGPQAPPSEAYMVLVDAEILDFIELRRDAQIIAEGPPLGGDGLLKIDLGKDERIMDSTAVVQGSQPAGFSAILATMQTELDSNNVSGLLYRIKYQLDPGMRDSLMNRLLLSMEDLNRMTEALRTELSAEERDSLIARLHLALANVQTATGSLADEMNPSRSGGLVGKVHGAMDTVSGSLNTVARIVASTETPINETLGHVASTASKLDTQVMENIARQTDPDNVEGLVSRVNKAASQLNDSLADIKYITGTTREILVLNRDNINKMLLNFKETSDHLKGAVKYVLERPWRLMNAPSQTEDRQQKIFDATRNFAEAANRLDDASAQLKALAEIHNGQIPTDNVDLVRLRSDLEATRAKFKQAEDQLWRELNVK